MRRAVQVLLALAGAVHLLPVAGALSAEALARGYGIALPGGDLLVLLRHRALLFGIVGGLLVAAAVRSHLQPAAIVAGLVSTVGFLAFALAADEPGTAILRVAAVDAVAAAALVGAAVLRRKASRTRGPARRPDDP